MRFYTLTIGLICFIFLWLISCTKNVGKAAAATIVGKWRIINDSGFSGVGLTNHAVGYTGKAGDYFDFRTDGNVYTKENTTLDTLSYQVISDSTIIIESFGMILNGVPEASHITTLTTHNATISAPQFFTPGGISGRKVNLTR